MEQPQSHPTKWPPASQHRGRHQFNKDVAKNHPSNSKKGCWQMGSEHLHSHPQGWEVQDCKSISPNYTKNQKSRETKRSNMWQKLQTLITQCKAAADDYTVQHYSWREECTTGCAQKPSCPQEQVGRFLFTSLSDFERERDLKPNSHCITFRVGLFALLDSLTACLLSLVVRHYRLDIYQVWHSNLRQRHRYSCLWDACIQPNWLVTSPDLESPMSALNIHTLGKI